MRKEGGRDDRARGPVPCGIDPIQCSSAQVCHRLRPIDLALIESDEFYNPSSPCLLIVRGAFDEVRVAPRARKQNRTPRATCFLAEPSFHLQRRCPQTEVTASLCYLPLRLRPIMCALIAMRTRRLPRKRGARNVAASAAAPFS